MNLKNTQTEKNVRAAFTGESEARNKYACFAQAARAEGKIQTAELFEKMSENEKHHAMIWLKTLEDEVGTTEENLQKAISAENFENTDMYKGFAEKARQEGFEQIADMFDRVAFIEKDHEEMFKRELARLNNKEYDTPQPVLPKTVEESKPPEAPKPASPFTKTAQKQEPASGKQKWRCPICGLVEESDEPPYLCTLCGALGIWDRV